MNPCQSTVPLQTNPNNFQTYQQTSNQQSTQCSACPGNSQGQYTQGPFSQFYQQEGYLSGKYPCTTQLPTSTNNPCQGIPCQNQISSMQTQAANCGPLPQNIIDQIRSCIANTTPIFIIPGGCQQPVVATQQAASTPGILNPLATANNQSSSVPHYISSSPPPICPPSFYPYPIPFPIFDPFGVNKREQQKNCGCSTRSNAELMGLRQCPPLSYCTNSYQEEEHRCSETTDDTICSKRNCPSAISLQALASQLLSIQGIVSCTATRLLLRKIPASNITTSMEDTMERAQRSINVLNKDQLLVESRNSQQVNALINLHMTANPPANIIPILTLVQLKVNVLKALVENLINRKLMENQGLEVEATDSIDPTILALKTDAELREFLVILKQKECDERVNLNFAPYRSQRVIAENRLNNVQKKIQQVELEFERRRCNVVPSIPISSQIVREFAETPCNFSNLSYPGLMSPTIPERMEESRKSPDPFAITLRCPRKLRLKPHVGSPDVTYDYSNKKPTQRESTSIEKSSQSEPTKDKKHTDCPNREICTCYEGSSSEESLEEDKKKLQLKIDERGNVTVTSNAKLKDVSFMKLASNVSLQTRKPNDVFEKRNRKVKSTPSEIDSKDFRKPSLLVVPKVEEISEVTQIGEPFANIDIDLVADVKAYDTVSENERESFARARLTLEEFKVDADALKDKKEETKISISDVNGINGENAKNKTANSKIHFKELTTLNDKEVQIPKNKFDKIITSIKEEPIEPDKVKTNAHIEESEMEIATNNLEEKLSSIKENKNKVLKSKTPESKITKNLEYDDITKLETTDETEEMIEAGKPKETFISTASIKIEPPEVDELETNEYTEETTESSTKIVDEFLEKPKKTFLTTFKIDKSIKFEDEDEARGMLEVERPKKTFVTTASIKIEPPKVNEPETNEYTEETTESSTKIANEILEKPKKTFLTTFKIDNSIKPEDKRPKKTFISTASIKIEPPKNDEQEKDEYIKKTTSKSSELTDGFWEKPKKTFLTTLKIGNSKKSEDKKHNKTFISTASIKIEPLKGDEQETDEYTEEIMGKSSKIANELSEKPKKTFVTTLKVGNATKPEVERPKKTFISTASIKIEPPKVDEQETDEYTEETTARSSKIADNLFIKPENKFLTTLRIGNSIKPEVEDKKTETIESKDSEKSFVSKAFIKIKPENHEDRQLESKIFKENWNEMKMNLIKKEGKENEEKKSSTVDSARSFDGLYKTNFVLEGTNEKSKENNVNTNTVASISIGKEKNVGKEKKMSTFLTEKGRKEKIVSMLTEIKYDEPEAIAERFQSALTRNFQLDNDVIDRCCEAKYERTETGNYYTMALASPENRFPWRIDFEKHANDIKQFNNQRRDARFENTFLPEKTWTKLNTYDPNVNRFPFVNNDRETSKCHFEEKKGLLSEMISLMSNQITYFSNAINKIAVFRNILSSYDESETSQMNLTSKKNTKTKLTNFERIWTNPCKEYLAILEDVKKLDENGIKNRHYSVTSIWKKSMKKLDKKEQRVIGKDSLDILIKDNNNKVRNRLKHLIIKNKDNRKSYLIPENSFRGLELQPYKKPNLGRPYKIRRNLLIRSRLKDNHTFKQNLLPPFTIVKRKRERNYKSFREIPRQEKNKRTLGRVQNVKNYENFFCSLPLIKGKNSKISFTIKKSSTSKAIPNESDTKTTITFLSTDSCVSTEESFILETT
ncbi:hypothetical protein M0804_003073 [Polistes exclamans]|nr:hypothetical protein M0804_003073 [Polistes exclamans]